MQTDCKLTVFGVDKASVSRGGRNSLQVRRLLIAAPDQAANLLARPLLLRNKESCSI